MAVVRLQAQLSMQMEAVYRSEAVEEGVEDVEIERMEAESWVRLQVNQFCQRIKHSRVHIVDVAIFAV